MVTMELFGLDHCIGDRLMVPRQHQAGVWELGLEDTIVALVTAGLDLSTATHRLRAIHARRRAHALVEDNPTGAAEQLALVVTREQAVVSGFVTQRLIELTAPTAIIHDALVPAHLDLDSVSQLTSSTGMVARSLHGRKRAEYLAQRARWIPQIIWEAAALHGDALWSGTGASRTLRADALADLFDRRLRVVERMTYNVNVSPTIRVWQVPGGATGPWFDGNQMRLFEYPGVPVRPFQSILGGDPDWQASAVEMIYEPADGSPPVRLPDSVADAFQPIATTYGVLWVEMRGSPTVTRTDALLGLFDLPRPDFRQRAWLFCDMVGVALALEALWFSRCRRTGSAGAFEAIFAGRALDYASLGPVISHSGVRDLDILLADGSADPYFENLEVPIHELQIGDFVVFWNSRIYSMLVHGAWGSEYSYVMHVERDVTTGKVRTRASGPQIWLAGHGLATCLYNAMAMDLLDQVVLILDGLRQFVIAAVAANPTAEELVAPWRQTRLRRWDPYESFAAPGAWWIEIPRGVWQNDWGYGSAHAAVAAIPRTVAGQGPGPSGPGFRPPPVGDALYFPLMQPVVTTLAPDHDPWRSYLAQRAADTAFRPFLDSLSPLVIDASVAPGLYYRGSQSPISVVRPRVSAP
ncbi:MAG: hypothetical protein IPL61_36435 [Myxococcales bacterium]|nr:hypothetical protein [Myxococcales bacterium]